MVGTRKRVGVLLGTSFKGTVDVNNSYACSSPFFSLLPFEEDEKDTSIWFLDHNYHESMFKRINGRGGASVILHYMICEPLIFVAAKEHVVGCYVPNLVMVIIDVQPKELGIPTKAYYDVEEVKENSTQKSQMVFVHVPSEIAAHEVEEIDPFLNLKFGWDIIVEDVKENLVMIYMKGVPDFPQCGFSSLAVRLLKHHSNARNILEDLELKSVVKAFRNAAIDLTFCGVCIKKRRYRFDLLWRLFQNVIIDLDLLRRLFQKRCNRSDLLRDVNLLRRFFQGTNAAIDLDLLRHFLFSNAANFSGAGMADASCVVFPIAASAFIGA
ncbi:S-adenosyl-L-methionine-dependent methyltransferases superfamily protein [Hibiscus syriacus]|uniref:S-adenosyl-L-methionine-dependent methyltransferases superfamily protein n=1 Tax=Hibiscus syriacus TaxID=106335 RepID=A0A6A3C7M9_HIBSY|nr:S-adenosyl-L-methionine-dependent methyltransferases superfamily protein [Hibiscus syriacus]